MKKLLQQMLVFSFASSFPLQGTLFCVTLVLRRCYKSVTKKTSNRRLPAARLW
jgi:hypothetical protein